MLNRRISNKEISEIKKIPIIDVLRVLGIEPIRNGNNLFFPARWRGERRPSCQISNNNCYCDYGDKAGNTVIDLVMQDQNMNFGRALHFLFSHFMAGARPEPTTANMARPEPRTRNRGPLWNIIDRQSVIPEPVVWDFWNYRKLTADELLSVGCEYIRIQHTEETHLKIWVMAHRNINGGYACFQAKHRHKGGMNTVISPHSMSFIKGGNNTLIIAESVINALSARIITGNAKADLLSLNSVSMALRAAKALRKRPEPYHSITFALDNDNAGRKEDIRLRTAIKEFMPDSAFETMTLPVGADPNDLLRSQRG